MTGSFKIALEEPVECTVDDLGNYLKVENIILLVDEIYKKFYASVT